MTQESNQIIEAIVDLKEDIREVNGDVQKIRDKVHSMEVTLSRNTDSLEIHMNRTKMLEEIVKPLNEEMMKRLAVQEYKVQQKAQFINRIKIPMMVGATLVSVGTIITLILGLM